MATKSKIEILISAKDTGLQTALKRAQVEVKSFGSQISGAAAPFRSLISSALSLQTALAGIVAGAGITALGSSLLKAGQEMDRLRLAYTAISGSGQNAAKEMQFVSDTANRLGLDLQTAAQAYKQIAAAAQGTSLAGRQTQQIFTAIAKASTVLGLSADETSGALTAISQMISKGKVSAEELRGQLGERLPGAFQIAAQAMGVTTGALDKMLADGQVFSDVFLPKFAAALEQRFGQASIQASNTFTTASNRISSEFFKIQSAVGQAVTNNTFFVEAMGKVSTVLQTISKDAANNGAQWRLWAKESALAVLQFVADTSSGFNEVYKSLSFLAGTLKLSYVGAITLGKGFQYLFEQANRLTGNTDKADFWARAQVEATRLIDQAMAEAVKSFDNAEQGSKTLETVTTRLEALKQELAKIKTDEVNPVENIAKQADLQFKNIADRWYGVEKQIQESNQETTKKVGVNWGDVWRDFEKNGLSAADAVNSALDKAARDREVTLKVREVQAHATGGLIQRFARGGHLPGYGGGDRISALLEAGEYVIRKEAVARYGHGLFHALNNLRLPELPQQRFATGGPVGGGDSMTVHLAFAGGSSVPVTSTREQARALLREFDRMGWRASS